jgi:GNAT superfamily N-acetyltransferase
MSSEYTIRRATAADTEMIVHQRSAMFIEMGVDETLVRRWEAPFGVWVRERLESGAYQGWLAVDGGGAVVAGAGLWIHEWVPSPLSGKPLRGYILNVYTEPDHRQKGLARRLVAETLDYCREQEIPTAALNASEAGRPIYEAMGFTDTGELRLRLE